ncbi:MAG: hypothetical protein B6A08_04140 [Sorangiineae bacterium NIC37A_2]|nr:MAG: hypothetical protein B6A08_04140 [Sorangiineae bacterium NIC37A_2]
MVTPTVPSRWPRIPSTPSVRSKRATPAPLPSSPILRSSRRTTRTSNISAAHVHHESSSRAYDPRHSCRPPRREASAGHRRRRRLSDRVLPGRRGSSRARSDLGPYVIESPTEPVVVGEIGGAFTGPGTVEIGYAVVRSHFGRGIATAAVRELVSILRGMPEVERIVAHTPFDHPESARVVEKAGFTLVGEIEDSHEGQTIRVQEWELRIERP